MAEDPNALHVPAEVLAQAGIRSDEFSGLLEKIEYATAETKKLWREVYENAMDDRAHAYLLFADLYSKISGSMEAHAISGKLIASYLERMNKSNDQLLKLAELVEQASSGNEQIDADALYEETAAHDVFSKKGQAKG